jgi:hypothetical protein
MNQDFAQSRLFYQELAKIKRDRKWTMICLANVLRIMNKEKAAVSAATVSNTFDEIGW